MQRYRDSKIPIDKFEISNCCFNFEFSYRMDKWIDVALQNGVKGIVYGSPNLCIPSYCFPIIKVLAAKYLRELVLNNCDIMCVSLSSGAENCHSLRKLSLSDVWLDENVLQAIPNSCPLIVSLILKTPTLEHLSFSNYSSENLDIVECQNLKSLELSEVEISDGFFDNLISKSQSLKVLKIQYCSGIREIDTSNLEVLKIVNCSGIRVIDSSNLVSLEYIGAQIPQLKKTSESSQLKHSKIVLHDNNYIDVAWFRKLRNFLSNLTSSSQVLIGIYQFDDINIKGTQLQQKYVTPKVDILNIEFLREECPTFVDALVWSCHPKRLNLFTTPEMTKCFIDCLMDMKSPIHSSSQRPKNKSRLKELKAFDREDQLLQLKSAKQAIRTLRKRKTWELYFLLDW
ncbi:hypothetical protein T459_31130 [Capsicum annuum]|uniref:At1g61320/AtMIF1 LRR domain-containing protein n=1 Tax=Capsicum annuum TaxID=4072 RepID=A0A2G2YAC4_CAPAN|nr:hypothetical protein FXO37_13650 [Capsicum annuum]PHT66705.1 hypothetical protein T459_31130 [Capsicum annuum]